MCCFRLNRGGSPLNELEEDSGAIRIRETLRLYGGRGGVFGSIFGAVLVQTTSNGLVMLNANPYLYPLVNSVIIFIAAWVDGRRRLMTERLEQRKIRVEA